MASKSQMIYELSEATVKGFSNSTNNWTSFLKTAAWNYKYSFHDQILIYAQKPEAIACADIETWNNQLHRWVNRGTKGIALLVDNDGHFSLKHIFDVSDTNSYYGNEVKLWQYKESFRNDVIETLESTFGELDNNADIVEAIKSAAKNAVADNKADYIRELIYAKEDSFLEDLDDFNIEVAFEKSLENSIGYMMLQRLGIDPDDIFEKEDFNAIINFNTVSTITVLGSATGSIVEMGLKNIAETVKQNEREEKLSAKKFAKDQNVIHNIGNKNNERNGEYGSNISQGIGLSNSEFSSAGEQSTDRQIRNAPQDLHQTKQTEPILHADDNGQVDTAPFGNRQDSQRENRTDGISNDETGENPRQSDQSDGLGADDEQSSPFRRGNSAYGAGLQLTLFPTVEEQQNIIEKAEQLKSSAFSISQQVIDEVLCSGSNQNNSTLRICTQYQNNKSAEQNIEFLKKEYATGGKGFYVGGNKVSIWFNNDGIRIAEGMTAFDKSNTYLTWDKINIRISELLELGRFMPQTDIDKASYNERKELADKIWYLHQDLDYETDVKYFISDEVFDGGFPESTERIAKLLGNRQEISKIVVGLFSFVEQYEQDRSILRYHFHKPKELLQAVSDLLIERKIFTSNPIFKSQSAMFITQDELDEVLTGGSGMSQGKFRVYSYFLNHSDLQGRIKFLKSEYGDGGTGRQGFNEWHDSKGITYSRGDLLMPYDKVVLPWNKVAKRIDELMAQNRYMSQKELDYIPTYEKEIIAMGIYNFYSNVPQEIPHPFPYGFDHYGAMPIVVEQLDDGAKVSEILNGMTSVMNDTLPNDRHYEYMKKAFDNLVKYQNGTFSLFKKHETVIEGTQSDVVENKEAVNESVKYELHLGDTVHIGEDEYEIMSFDNNEVVLFDTELPMLNEKMNRAEFDRKLHENPLNDQLISFGKPQIFLEIYNQIKSQYNENTVILYQVGDFFEAYGADADVVADTLNIFRTNKTIDGDIYLMCGIVNRKLEEYTAKLNENGLDVVLVNDNREVYKVFSVQTEKQYDLGFGNLGNGTTVWNRFEEVDNDYKTIAHIDDNGTVNFYDNDLPDEVKKQITSFSENQKINMQELLQEDEVHENINGSDTLNTQAEITEAEVLEQVETPIPIGAEITIGDRKFIIDSVNDLFGKVSLKDITFQNSTGFPIFRSESIDFVKAIIEEEKQKPIIPSFEKPKVSSRVANYDIHLGIPLADRHNFKITDDELGFGGAKEKYRNNIEAIKTLQRIESENRFATPEEQEILSRYVGWGGIPEAFDEHNTSWTNEYVQLKSLLDETEYSNARESTLNAFYTSPIVIKSMYHALLNMGFKTGNILEPSCGIGNFLGLLPDNISNSKIYGIELDSITGRIAQQLYQKSSIQVAGFEKSSLPDSFFDVAIGNVPFGQYKIADKRYDKNNFLVHDYFFAKTLDKVRPGGIVAFITSSGTMDKKNPSVRKYIAQRADLLGAIRLPNTAFKANAGTEVTSDILFLQKRDRMVDIEPDWAHLGKDENDITINHYFIDNPEMILGEMTMVSGPFGMESTCKPYENSDLAEQLAEAITNIHAEVTEYEFDDLSNDDVESIPADPNVRNFSFAVVDGDIYFRENSVMNKVEMSVTASNRIKGMIEIRDCVRNLIEYQTEDYSDETIRSEQSKLNNLYDKFIKKYGLLNSRANNMTFSDDSAYCLLCSLEILDENGELERKADMFTKRTIKQHTTVKSVDTASEALAVSLGEKAKVDIAFMGELTGKTEQELFEELKGVIFLNPMHTNEYDGREKYLTADEYLSGNVRDKLDISRRSAELYPDDYAINVKSLEAIQPKDLTASEITVRLGATWIPSEIIKQYMFELLETPRYSQWNIKIHYSKLTGEWNIEGKSQDRGNIKANSTYGTGRINAYKIIEETLNLRDVRIFDYVENENGNKTAVLNKKETTIAQQKQEIIKTQFCEWLWNDPDRREQLTRLYNDNFNNLRPREYDGSHLNFSGINPEISLRPHQVNAVAHIMYGGNTLLAHVVGAGKTFEMIAAAMESKRLGLCHKSLFVVPNHLTEQWASEFLQLYPSANIMVATKKDFETKNRKKFCGRIATGDYDAVIIGHSQFERIPMSVERQQRIIQQQLDEIVGGIDELKRNRGENFSIKQLEKTKKNLQVKLDKLNDQSRKDDVVTFEELGVDRLFVDESHFYKNLFLYTKMRNVGGIAQTEAQKSSDLFMKCRYLDEITGGRGIVFATGTPISNSMVELYTIQRYLQYNTLQRNGLQHFDSWASTFGETVTAIELAPEGTGYRAKTRFAKFYNLPELMSMFKEVADIQTADMLNLPVPKANYHNIAMQPTDLQKGMVADLSDRADKVRNKMVEPDVDNMLKITNDGRKLALDQRLMNDMLPDDVNSKVSTCANNVFDVWEKTKAKSLTQLVFCDLSTPHYDDSFNVYDDIKNKLISKGVSENEVAFIHDAKSEVQKKEMFAKVRKGQIRILIGSTFKMGAGTNCQDKLVALHDLDCPWRPSDLEQRSGRIIRQGNQNDEVDIFRYVTKDTFDSYLFQLVENKQKFISQVMTSKSPARSAEDIDETALSYAEIKALATGNPYIREKMNLDNEVSRLKVLKSSHLSQKYALEDAILKHFPKDIKQHEERIEGYKADVELLSHTEKPTDDKFSPMVIDGVTYLEKETAGKAIIERCKKMTAPEAIPVGAYRGFNMELSFDTFSKEYRLTLKNRLSHTIALGSDTFGNITRIENAFDGFSSKLQACEELFANTKTQFETAKIEVEKPFSQEDELTEKSKRLDELNILLNMDQKENEIVDGDTVIDEEIDLSKDKLQKKEYDIAR